MIQKKSGYYTFSQFEKLPIVAFFTFGKTNYSLSAGDISAAAQNRKNLLGSAGVDPTGLICLNQVHSSRIAKVDKFDKSNGIQKSGAERSLPEGGCDGAYTTDVGAPIAVFTADCLSLFFYEPNKNIIGIVHAGWRGSFERIAAKMVRTLAKDCEASPKDLIVAFGPCIRECCYQVGEELAEYFPNSVDKRKGVFYLDLFRENKSQLLSEGVKEKNIFDSGICTSCENKNFFSYRLEKEKAGRMMSVISLA